MSPNWNHLPQAPSPTKPTHHHHHQLKWMETSNTKFREFWTQNGTVADHPPSSTTFNRPVTRVLTKKIPGSVPRSSPTLATYYKTSIYKIQTNLALSTIPLTLRILQRRRRTLEGGYCHAPTISCDYLTLSLTHFLLFPLL